MSATEIKIYIPHLPRHDDTLASIPRKVQDEWAARYEAKFREAHAAHAAAIEHRNLRSGPEPVGSPHAIALAHANELLRVAIPTSLDEAREIPDWHLMKRGEVEYGQLPSHLKRGLPSAAKYFYIFTSEGREYVFPIAAPRGKKSIAETGTATP